jgi:hypothetical protein
VPHAWKIMASSAFTSPPRRSRFDFLIWRDGCRIEKDSHHVTATRKWSNGSFHHLCQVSLSSISCGAGSWYCLDVGEAVVPSQGVQLTLAEGPESPSRASWSGPKRPGVLHPSARVLEQEALNSRLAYSNDSGAQGSPSSCPEVRLNADA